MNILRINVPDRNDSVSRVTLNEKQYLIRFTYNYYADRWSFSVYTLMQEPLAVNLRIVPDFPLNLHVSDRRFPAGFFAAYTDRQTIGRDDFVNGNAHFAFMSFG